MASSAWVRSGAATFLVAVSVTGCADASDPAVAPSPVTDSAATSPAATVAPASADVTIADSGQRNPATPIPVSPDPDDPTTATTTGPTTTTSRSPTSAAPAPAECEELAVGVTEFTLRAGGAEHHVRVFVPSDFDRTRLPVVLNWHGLGGNGPDHAAVTSYEPLAEVQRFIAVHPTGVPAVGDSRNSWQLVDSDDGRDDVVFADSLIDHLVAEWCADPARIYSTGMSNGGFFTARLVCELADRLAAASSVGGLYHPEGCLPARPVPFIAYHGTDDTIVPFDGDGRSLLLGSDPDPALMVFAEQVIPDEFAEFAADASCSPAPSVSTIGDVVRYDYSGCADATPMVFFEVTGGGHTWPNWPIADAVDAVFGSTTTDVDATVDSWTFFRQHALTP